MFKPHHITRETVGWYKSFSVFLNVVRNNLDFQREIYTHNRQSLS